jgi:hypothetical protein
MESGVLTTMTYRNTILGLFLFAGFVAAAHAAEVYHWVDENGVHHFSQTQPDEPSGDVSTMAVESEPPPGYDPEADIYGVEQQQERMAEIRAEMESRRQERLEERRRAARQQQPVQYAPQSGYSYSFPGFWYPGYPDRPPVRPEPPEPPVVEPHPSVPFRPPGSPKPYDAGETP